MLPGPYIKEKTSRRADLPNSKSNASGLTARQFQNLIAPHLNVNATAGTPSMTVIKFFTLCPSNISTGDIFFRRTSLLLPVFCSCHIRKVTHKARNLYQAIFLLFTWVNDNTNPIPCQCVIRLIFQHSSSKNSTLLTDTS